MRLIDADKFEQELLSDYENDAGMYSSRIDKESREEKYEFAIDRLRERPDWDGRKEETKIIYDIDCNSMNCWDCKDKFGVACCPKFYADEFRKAAATLAASGRAIDAMIRKMK